MAKSEIKIKVYVKWWVFPYMKILNVYCRFLIFIGFKSLIDLNKHQHFIMKGISVKHSKTKQ